MKFATEDSLQNSDTKRSLNKTIDLSQVSSPAKGKIKLLQINKSVDFCALETSLSSIMTRSRNPVENVQIRMELDWKVNEARKILNRDFFA